MAQLSSSSLNSSQEYYTFTYSKHTINESQFTQTLGTLYRIWAWTWPHPCTFTHTSEECDPCSISWCHSIPQISLNFLKPGSFFHSEIYSEMQTHHSVSPEFLPFHSCITCQCGECLSLPSLKLPNKWLNLLSTASFFCTAFSEDSLPPSSAILETLGCITQGE